MRLEMNEDLMIQFFSLPIWSELGSANTVLIAGAGGGFDVFTGLPLYFALKAAGKQVFLANLSFSAIYGTPFRRMGEALVEVTADRDAHLRYFPELHLARWFQSRDEPTPIYCFDRTGVRPLIAAYQRLCAELKPDAVVLVDGGTDSLMRGDEVGLGTPEEDIASIAAVDCIDVPVKLLVCLGFGIDSFHGVCHSDFLESVAALTQSGGFLGCWSLLPGMPEAVLYREACEYVFQTMFNHPSIVNASILSAIEGQFGDYHATYRTSGSELFINPLMALYWAFRVDEVAQRNLYIDRIRTTETYWDLQSEIGQFREELTETKPWRPLPM